MLITLQKESRLLDRTDPTESTYNAAWGWHCPDTGPGGRVDGIDTNVASVDEARRRAATLPPEYARRIVFAEGDALDLPFDDSSFDLVVCGGATSFIADQAAAVNEFQRVLRPLGSFRSPISATYRRLRMR